MLALFESANPVVLSPGRMLTGSVEVNEPPRLSKGAVSGLVEPPAPKLRPRMNDVDSRGGVPIGSWTNDPDLADMGRGPGTLRGTGRDLKFSDSSPGPLAMRVPCDRGIEEDMDGL
jgi:hypothetical protein